MKEKGKKQENMDVKKHLTPEEDEKLHDVCKQAVQRGGCLQACRYAGD